MKKIVSILLALVLVLGVATTAFAAGTVTYDGAAKEFIFAPGSSYSPTDLFENLKNVMPGDKLTEQILVKNTAGDDVEVKLYLRSLGAQKNTAALLSQMTLTVEQAGSSVLFSAPADQTAQLTDWVCLGTFAPGAEVTLNVTLDVPVTLGNEFANAAGYIDWQFKVEEFPVEPESSQPESSLPESSEPESSQPEEPDSPQTGDDSNMVPFVVMLLCSAVALAILLPLVKRRREDA